MNTVDDNEFMKMVAGDGEEPKKDVKQTKPTTPKPERKAPKQKKNISTFKEIFLKRVELEDRRTLYVSRETYEQLRIIINGIGSSKASVSGYVERIIQVHFEQHKDEIIKLFNENLKQPFQ